MWQRVRGTMQTPGQDSQAEYEEIDDEMEFDEQDTMTYEEDEIIANGGGRRRRDEILDSTVSDVTAQSEEGGEIIMFSNVEGGADRKGTN